MTAGERLAFEGYFSYFEDENSDESDDEYVPRDLLWRKVRYMYMCIKRVCVCVCMRERQILYLRQRCIGV